MSELELAGETLPELPAAVPEIPELQRLTAAWLGRAGSEHTSEAYQRDLADWLAFCQQERIHPLTAGLSDVDAWIAAMREGRAPIHAPSPKTLRVPIPEAILAEARALQAAGQFGPAARHALAARAGVGETTLRRRLAATLRPAPRQGAAPAPAAPRTICRRVSTISSWYIYLVRATAHAPEPLIRYNPAAGAATPKVRRQHSPTRGLDAEEGAALIRAADAAGLLESAVIRLMLTNAVRVGVLTSLQVGDLRRDDGHETITLTVKGGHKMRQPVPPPAMRAIRAYLDARGDPKDGPLFIAPRAGGPLRRRTVAEMVRRLARDAGIAGWEDLSPHSLRHTAITAFLRKSGGNIPAGQALAGHADPSTTMIYFQRYNELDGHGAYTLATLWAELTGETA